MAAGSLTEVWADIKKHPYIASAVVFVGGAILIYAYYSGGGTPAPQGDPNAGARQAALGQEAIQAQLAASRNAADSARQSNANQVNGAVQIAGIQAGAYGVGIGAGQTVDLAQIDAGKVIALGSLAAYNSHDAHVYDYLNNQLFSNERVAADQITTNSVMTQNIIADALGSRVIGQNLANTTVSNAVNQAAAVAMNGTPVAAGAINIYLPAGATTTQPANNSSYAGPQ